MSRAPYRHLISPLAGLVSFTKANLFLWVALLAILNYAVLALWYTGLDNYFSFAEPNIASISWAIMEGQPLYHALDAAEQYSMVYGPYLFLINGLFLRLLGPSIFATKFAGALFAVMSVLCVIYSVMKVTDSRKGFIAGGFLVLTYFAFWPFSTFIARADALILGLVGLALVAVHARTRWGCIALATAALGVSAGVKPHTALYFLPIWMMMYQRFGWSAFFVAGFSACAVTLAPFALLPNVSITNYISWLHVVAETGIDNLLLWGNIRNMSLNQLLPVVMILSIIRRPFEVLQQHKLLVGTVAVCLTIIMPIASVDGAGKFHLLPFSIVIIYWLARIFHEKYSRTPAAAAGARWFDLKHKVIYFLLLVMVLIAFPVNRRMLKLMNFGGRYNGAAADIRQILSMYPGKAVGMGDGETKHNELTNFRPLLLFAGNPYLLDAATMMVRINAGYGIGSQTLDAIRSCRMDIWLVPKENRPFTIDNVYRNAHGVYNDEFRTAFHDNYEMRTQIGHYDLWFCKTSR